MRHNVIVNEVRWVDQGKIVPLDQKNLQEEFLGGPVSRPAWLASPEQAVRERREMFCNDYDVPDDDLDYLEMLLKTGTVDADD